jgi:hypothetical protein
VSSDNKLPATRVGGHHSSSIPDFVQGDALFQRVHVTYWWQIEALMQFERDMWLLEWANVELRNDE